MGAVRTREHEDDEYETLPASRGLPWSSGRPGQRHSRCTPALRWELTSAVAERQRPERPGRRQHALERPEGVALARRVDRGEVAVGGLAGRFQLAQAVVEGTELGEQVDDGGGWGSCHPWLGVSQAQLPTL
jgi:hypothetical protein